MTKSKKNCIGCMWDVDNHCADFPTCDGCPKQLPDESCVCSEVNFGEECPYYEPFKPEVEE